MGAVGIDSGQLLIVDPCYLNEHKQLSSYEDILQARGFPDKMDYADQLKYDLGHNGLGVVFNSGPGDGVYKVYGKMKDCGKLGKRLAEVKIILIKK
jgi:hypothetical protein